MPITKRTPTMQDLKQDKINKSRLSNYVHNFLAKSLTKIWFYVSFDCVYCVGCDFIFCIISTIYRLYHVTVAVLVTIWSFCLNLIWLEILTKLFPVKKLSAEVAGFLIGGGSLAYRLDSTWKLIDRRRRRTAAVLGSNIISYLVCIHCVHRMA